MPETGAEEAGIYCGRECDCRGRGISEIKKTEEDLCGKERFLSVTRIISARSEQNESLTGRIGERSQRGNAKT